MRTVMLLVCALAGCAVDLEPETTEGQSDLICSPLCDGGYQSVLQDAFSYGFAQFFDARSTDASCADIGTSIRRWDCVVTFVADQNPCGTFTVECVEQGPGQPPRCSWTNPYNCP